jgi:hypothetical protein
VLNELSTGRTLPLPIADQTCQCKQWTKIMMISEKAKEACYTIAEIMT